MNMISSEQDQAWNALPEFYKIHADLLIASGIPLAQRDAYLAIWKYRGWLCTGELAEEGWLGFCLRPVREENAQGT